MKLFSDFELENVRKEIREFFEQMEPGTWCDGFPVKIETMLLLQELNCNISFLLKLLQRIFS